MRCLTLQLVLMAMLCVGRARADGIVSWGDDRFGQVSDTPTGTDFIAVAAGWNHSLALTTDGSIIGWGEDNYGQISDAPAGTGFKAVATGSFHSLALTADGSIISWGEDTFGEVSNTPTGTGFKAIAASFAHSLALTSDGSIVAWGYDDQGQVSDAPTGTGFTAIAAGEYHSLALTSDGSIVAWGGSFGESVPDGDGFTAIAAGVYFSLAMAADGSIIGWGNDSDGQVSDAPDGPGFTAIAAGGWHSLALDAEGVIYGWGDDANGNNIPTGTGFTGIAAGAFHGVAMVCEPYVESVDVTGGGVSRSMVNSLVVTFGQLVTIDAGAFEVIQRGTGAAVDVSFTTEDANGRTMATLTFSGALTEYGSLVDGNYQLIVRGDLVCGRLSGLALDGDEDGAAGGDYVFGDALVDNFFRLFGDLDGSRFVGNNDYAAFRLAFRKSPGEDGYDPQFDSDNSGFIGNNDYALFRLRFRTGLPFE